MAGKLAAIFWKDLLSSTSYRLSFVLQFVTPLFMILSFYFLSRLVDGTSLEGLQPYGGDYFSFALVGIVFMTYTGLFLGTVVSTIRTGQTLGTLELVLTTQTSLPTYLLGSSLYALLRGTVMMGAFLLLGTLVFGVDFQGANYFAAILVMVLGLLTVLGLGILSGSFILVFKQGDPFSMAVSAGVFLLSGVVYPVSVLPGWLQAGSWVLPHTHALEALRLALLQGASIAQLAPQLLVLALFGSGILLAGLILFSHAFHRARVEGSFTQY
jgi:ABC-2 type transport system permease protein